MFQTGRGLPQASPHPAGPLVIVIGKIAVISLWIGVPLLVAVAQRLKLDNRNPAHRPAHPRAG